MECADFVFWQELKKCFLFFFLECPFFTMLGILFSCSVVLIKLDYALHIIKHLTTPNNNISTEWLLDEYIEAIHVLIC